MATKTLRPSQAPPARVVEWDFSFNRASGQFRWRHQGLEFLCNRIAGRAWCRSADGERGHLYLVCQIDFIDDDGTIQAWEPQGAALAMLQREPIITQEGTQEDSTWRNFPQGRESHWRMCYFRQFRAWRLRDEKTSELFITNGYRGMLNLSWMDGGTHVFHDGEARVDERGVVRFGDQ